MNYTLYRGDGGPGSTTSMQRFETPRRVVPVDHFTKKLFCCTSVWMVVVVTGLLIAVVVLLAGAASSSEIMVRTGESTVGMRKDMLELRENGQAYLEHLRRTFPPNQMEITAHEITSIISNAHRISARLAILLESVQPEHMRELGARAVELSKGVSVKDVRRMSQAAATVAEHVGAMSKQADDTRLVDHFSAIAKNAGILTEQLARIHQITLAWGSATDNYGKRAKREINSSSKKEL